ncbi:MAG: sugar ABC transporter substrate-binding protein, partial [Anaerolineales bacterium]
MKRYWMVVISALLVLALLAGCTPAGGTAKEAKYGLFMSHMTNAFTIELSDAVKSKAQELGVNLAVYDGGQDAAKQVSQVETAVNEGIAAIVIEPVSVDGIIPAIETAKKAKIPVVTVNQNISKPELVDCFVGVSHVEGGS